MKPMQKEQKIQFIIVMQGGDRAGLFLLRSVLRIHLLGTAPQGVRTAVDSYSVAQRITHSSEDRFKMLLPVNSRLLFISTFKADLPCTKVLQRYSFIFCLFRFVVLSLRIVLINLCTEIFLGTNASYLDVAYLTVAEFCFATGGKQFNQEHKIAACFISLCKYLFLV